jgi:hypothetical protein
MPNFVDINYGKTPAEAADIQQIIDMLTGRRNTSGSIFTNDPIAYALTLKNTDPGSRGLVVYAADGITALLQVDSAGAKLSRAGGPAVAPLTDLGPQAGAAAEGNHTHGSGGYTGTGTVTLENLYSGTWITVSANYGAGGTFGANVLYVFCAAGVTVTLPAAGSTNRPITIAAITGSTTVDSAGGSIIGGSVNITTGAVMNGVISPGDTLTYKSDSTNWRAV